MPQVAAAVAAAEASAAVAAAVTAATGGALLGAIAGAATSLLVNAAVGKLLGGRDGDGGTLPTQTINTTIRQSAAPRRLVYGTTRTGGVLVYPGLTADGTAHLVVAVCEGEIDGFESAYWVGEDLSTDDKFAGLLTAEFYTGTTTQAASAALVAALPTEWTTAHRLQGIAYAYLRMAFDRNAFANGLVFPAFLVRGRKVFDPRTNTTAWSENPALCMLDFLRSAYCVAAPDDLIDFDSFSAAANVCDEIIDSADAANVVDAVPGKLKRYTLNGVFDVGSSPVSTIATIEAACAGKLIFTQGQYRFYAGAWRAAEGTLSAEYLRAPPTFRTHTGRQARVNIARGAYREPRQDWQDTDFYPQTMGPAMVAEEGEIVQSFSFPATSNGATAQRLARLAMQRARAQTPLVLQCNWAALRWRLWSPLAVDLPELGIDAGRTWVITEYSFAEGGGIDLTLLPDEPDHYAWTAADEVTVQDVPIPVWGSDPPAITGLSVSGLATEVTSGEARPTLAAEWDATTDPFFEAYEVQRRVNGAGGWDAGQTVTLPKWVDVVSVVGTSYDVRVRLVRTDGTSGAWAEVLNTTVDADTIPPSAPTGASVSGTGTHTIYWTMPYDADVNAARVSSSTVNDFGSATPFATLTGAPGEPMSATNTPGAATYYWVQARDIAGNFSIPTYAGTAT